MLNDQDKNDLQRDKELEIWRLQAQIDKLQQDIAVKAKRYEMKQERKNQAASHIQMKYREFRAAKTKQGVKINCMQYEEYLMGEELKIKCKNKDIAIKSQIQPSLLGRQNMRINLNVNTSFSVLAGMSANSLMLKSPLNGLANQTPHNKQELNKTQIFKATNRSLNKSLIASSKTPSQLGKLVKFKNGRLCIPTSALSNLLEPDFDKSGTVNLTEQIKNLSGKQLTLRETIQASLDRRKAQSTIKKQNKDFKNKEEPPVSMFTVGNGDRNVIPLKKQRTRPNANPIQEVSEATKALAALDKSLLNLFDQVPTLYRDRIDKNGKRKKMFDLTQKLSENLQFLKRNQESIQELESLATPLPSQQDEDEHHEQNHISVNKTRYQSSEIKILRTEMKRRDRIHSNSKDILTSKRKINRREKFLLQEQELSKVPSVDLYHQFLQEKSIRQDQINDPALKEAPSLDLLYQQKVHKQSNALSQQYSFGEIEQPQPTKHFNYQGNINIF